MDRLRHASRGGRRGVVGGAGLKERNDLGATVTGSHDKLLNPVGRHEVSERLAIDRAGRGHRNHGVAVRAEGEGPYRRHRHPQILGNEVGEAGRVEHARLPDDALEREPGDDLGKGFLRIRKDPVLKDMLRGLGAIVTEEHAPFEPESGAYGGGHHHHDDAHPRNLLAPIPLRQKIHRPSDPS